MSPRSVEQNKQQRAATMEKIFGAGVKVFARHGFSGATIKLIAADAGLSYGLVYHYFPSKEDLFRYVIDTSIERSISAATMFLTQPGPAWQKICTMNEFLVRAVLDGSSLQYFLNTIHALTQTAAIPGFRDHVSQRIAAYYELLAPTIAEAQAEGHIVDGDPYTLAATYFNVLQGLGLFSLQSVDLGARIQPDLVLRILRR